MTYPQNVLGFDQLTPIFFASYFKSRDQYVLINGSEIVSKIIRYSPVVKCWSYIVPHTYRRYPDLFKVRQVSSTFLRLYQIVLKITSYQDCLQKPSDLNSQSKIR